MTEKEWWLNARDSVGRHGDEGGYHLSTVEDIADWVLETAQSLVSYPLAVTVERETVADCHLIRLKVTPKCYRFIVGSHGCGIRALETLVVCMAGRIGEYVRLQLVEGK